MLDHFIDDFGNTISDPNMLLDLVPKSNLYNLQEYLNSTDWQIDNLVAAKHNKNLSRTKLSSAKYWHQMS